MIELKNIEKSYNGEKVLKGINLKIEDGDFISIMGRSGSGKTTLLNILGGFMKPDNGTVLWDNEDVYAFDDSKMAFYRSNNVGFVFQGFKLISTLSIKDNILLPASLSKKDNKLIEENFNNYIKLLNIDNLLEKYPDELSGGQCQRVAICRALCFEPNLLILDEPTGALDSENEKIVMELLTKVNNEKKMTIVEVTHSKKVSEYSKTVLNVLDGRII